MNNYQFPHCGLVIVAIRAGGWTDAHVQNRPLNRAGASLVYRTVCENDRVTLTRNEADWLLNLLDRESRSNTEGDPATAHASGSRGLSASRAATASKPPPSPTVSGPKAKDF